MNLTSILIETILEPAILWLRQHEHFQIPYNFQPFSINKNQVKLSLYLIKHHAKKMYGGSECIAPPFLTSALDGGEWSASRLGCFTSGQKPLVPIG
jgi:hypothetical protein